MKLLFLFFISFSLDLSIHQAKEENEIQMAQIIYRGYTNTIRLSDLPFKEPYLKLEGLENVTLAQNSPEEYTAIPSGISSTLKILVKNEKDETLGILVYSVRVMPKPELYLCGIRNGETIKTECNELIFKFPDDSQIEVKFDIESWECNYTGAPRVSSGAGGNFEQLKNMIKNAPIGSQISVFAVVVGPEGNKQKVAGYWKKIES